MRSEDILIFLSWLLENNDFLYSDMFEISGQSAGYRDRIFFPLDTFDPLVFRFGYILFEGSASPMSVRGQFYLKSFDNPCPNVVMMNFNSWIKINRNRMMLASGSSLLRCQNHTMHSIRNSQTLQNESDYITQGTTKWDSINWISKPKSQSRFVPFKIEISVPHDIKN